MNPIDKPARPGTYWLRNDCMDSQVEVKDDLGGLGVYSRNEYGHDVFIGDLSEVDGEWFEMDR